MAHSLKNRNCLSKKNNKVLQLPAWNHASQHQSVGKFKKAIELGLSMDMDLAVAKLNLAELRCQEEESLEATNLLNEAKKTRQTRYVERTDHHDEGQMKNIYLKGQMKSFALLLLFPRIKNTKKAQLCSSI
jgi:hypothetical protein